jgi:hypothetical protein
MISFADRAFRVNESGSAQHISDQRPIQRWFEKK